MFPQFNWSWVGAEVSHTIGIWNDCAVRPSLSSPRFGPLEHRRREKAYDNGLRAVEREARCAPRTEAERLATQDRIVSSFARFAATALDLEEESVRLITHDFLPVGIELAWWARRFDPSLSTGDIIQACRNAWTACGLQPLLGERAGITPSILGYSLLYPYTDNYLDRGDVTSDTKLRFSARFHDRLRGEDLPAWDEQEAAPWALVGLIEGQYPRRRYPQVFDCMLAIHRAQVSSIAQMRSHRLCRDAEILRISCAKGGSSVLADACLARGWLSDNEGRSSFEWGALLQLGDDLQDVHEDLERGSQTIFSRAAALGRPLDSLAMQLLNFSEHVGAAMDNLPNGSSTLKRLLRMSWRSLIIEAIARASEFFSSEFLQDAESRSPFRFAFLRERQKRLTGRHGLYEALFDAFLEAREGARESDLSILPPADCRCQVLDV